MTSYLLVIRALLTCWIASIPMTLKLRITHIFQGPFHAMIITWKLTMQIDIQIAGKSRWLQFSNCKLPIHLKQHKKASAHGVIFINRTLQGLFILTGLSGNGIATNGQTAYTVILKSLIRNLYGLSNKMGENTTPSEQV